MTEGTSSWNWSIDGATLRGLLRPDGQVQVSFPEGSPLIWADLGALAGADAAGPLLVNRPGDDPPEIVTALRLAGFTPVRTEVLWRIPVRSLTRFRPCDRHRLVPVTELDLAAVVDLDNAVREDIPGTAGWRGTVADLEETLADPEFDPQLYLVAQDRESGGLDGLVRVWDRDPMPRLGCLAVRRPWRRTRVAASLVAAVAGTLSARGVIEISTETATNNAAASRLAANHGGIRIGSSVEWVRPLPAADAGR